MNKVKYKLVRIAKIDAETPQRNPVMTNTIGTILFTSIPIKVATSGFSAIDLSARPSLVRFKKIEGQAT